MKKIVIFIIIIMMLSFVISSCDNDDNASKESKTQSNILSEIGTSGESKESLEELSKEFSNESAEEESAVPMPVGLTKIGDCIYLNLEGGNDLEQTAEVNEEELISFSNFEDLKIFMQKEKYTESEQKTMALTFVKDKYGIKLGDRNKAWVPEAEGFKINYCSWVGDGHFYYTLTNNKNGYVTIQPYDINNYESSKEYFDKRYKYEYIKENSMTTNHKLTKEIKDGIEYNIVDFETQISYCRYGYFEFEKGDANYNVYIFYKGIKKSEGDNLNKDIFLIQVLAKDNEKTWQYDLSGDAISEDIDYISSFQMNQVDTRK